MPVTVTIEPPAVGPVVGQKDVTDSGATHRVISAIQRKGSEENECENRRIKTDVGRVTKANKRKKITESVL